MFKEGTLKDGWVQSVEEGQGLPVVETPPPDSLEYGYKAIAHYEQRDAKIIKIWDIVPWDEQDYRTVEAEAQAESESTT